MSSNITKPYADYLIGKGYKLEVNEIARAINLGFSGNPLDVMCSIYFHEGYITVHATLPVKIPLEKVGAALEIFNKINTQRPIGNFEISPITNKAVFKIGIDTPPLPAPDYVERVLLLAVTNADTESKALLQALA